MHRQSHAFQRLAALYRALLLAMREAQDEAYAAFINRAPMRLHVELLQPRIFMSVTSSGAETLVNTTLTSAMQTPAIMMDPAGDTVVVWSSATGGIFGQRINAGGTKVGAQFRVDQFDAPAGAIPKTAMDDAGDFIVAWNGTGSSVYARLFNSAGTALTGDMLVTSASLGTSAPAVAMAADGTFTVAWEGSGSTDSDGIYARKFLSSGIASGGAYLVNTTTAGAQTNPSVATNAEGDTAFAWTDNSTTPSTIKAAFAPASGTAVPEFTAGSQSGHPLDNSAVGISASGSFVVTWQTSFGGATPWDVYGQRYSSTGTALDANPVRVNTTLSNSQQRPSVLMRPDGSFLVTWESNAQDGSGQGVYAQAYTSAGATDGGEFRVNTTTAGGQQDPAIAWSGNTAIAVWDGNGSGDSSGIFLQRYSTTGPTNAVPINTVPANLYTYINEPITFSTANGNAISVNDADLDGGLAQIALSATNGTLTLSQSTGLTFAGGAASNSATMTFTGTLANINAALTGMVFKPTANDSGSATVQITSNDLGNSGSGGAKSSSSQFSISLQSAPSNTTIPAGQSTVENTTLNFSPASENPIYIGSGWNYMELQVAHGTLTLGTKSGLSFGSGDGTNDATMEFGGSVAAMTAALNGLIFTPTTGYTGADTLTLTTSNGGLLGLGLFASTASSTIPLTVTATPPAQNQPPAIVVPAAKSIAEGASLTLSGSNAITVSDSDGGMNFEQVTLVATGGVISLAGPSGITFSSGTGTADQSMTISGTLANLNAAMNGLTFAPTALSHGSAGIFASISDLGNSGAGGAKSASASIAISISQVNQPPAVSLPAAQTAAENGNLVFSSNSANAITLSDSDDEGASEQLTLSTNHGRLTLDSTSGITLTSGANGSASMTLTGTLSALNAAVNGLSLSPTTGYTGSASISVSLNDLGNSGSGGALTASGTIPVTFVGSLVVTTASDVVDGTTTSIDALLTNPGTDGKISLREAIIASNNTPGLHEIDFDIAASGVQTISFTTALPQITNSVIIDATTEPGYAGAPIIELSGQGAPFGAIGLSVAASNCTFRGLSIYGFTGNGIDVLPVGANNIVIQSNYIGINAAGTAIYNGAGVVLANSANDLVGGLAASQRNVISGNFTQGVHIFGPGSTNDFIVGNYIGTDPTGTTAIPNGSVGVFVDGASGNYIGYTLPGGGNLISGNSGYGIEVGGASPANNVIATNYIGVNALGTAALANADDGIFLNGATGTLIGGTFAAARNVISGNSNAGNLGNGIEIDGGSGNEIQGNYIGTNAAGSGAIANYSAGVLIENSPDNLVGGTFATERNIISGNGGYGVEITGISASGNAVRGNYIGTNAGGDGSVSNGSDGVFLFATTGNFIGGTLSGAGNLISGNTSVPNLADGIWIDGGSANTIKGNQIGTTAAGNAALGNEHNGITIQDSANNVIGGIAAGAGNVIAHNTKGVVITGVSTGNAIRGNSIYANSAIGIDQGDDGVTTNTGSADPSRPNKGMNFPVLTSISITGTTLSVAGYVGTAAGQSAFAGAAIDFFKSDQSLSNGQGQIYLGTLTADANGNFTGTLSVSGLSVGNQLSATATDSSGNTSEFAANAPITLVNAPPVIAYPGAQSTGENAAILFSSGRGNAIRISDPDSDGAAEEATISVASGILTLSQTTGLTFQSGTANGSASLNFTGTLAAINAALNGLTFTPAQDFSGSESLAITANDLGHSGAGGAQSDTAAVTLGVAAVAHTPSVTNATTPVNTQSAPGGLVITANPLDGSAQGYYQITQIAGGTLFLSDGLTPVSNGQFITFAQGSAGLRFTPATNSIADGRFTAQASATSAGGLVGAPVSATITITGSVATPVTAHSPTITNAATNENEQSISGLVISPNPIDASTRIWFQITQIQGGELFRNDGVTPINSGDFITANQGEAGLKFTPAAGSTAAGSFTVQASTTSDISGLGGSVVSAAISVTPVVIPPPIAPVNTVPANQSGQQDTPLVFSTQDGNAIIVSDPGSNGSSEQITLTANHGTLTLASTTGITLISGSAAGDASMKFDGTLAAINAALNGLTFTPDAHYNGAARMEIVTQDLSANAGAPLEASSAVAIAVAPAVQPAPPPATTNPALPVETNLPPQASAPVASSPIGAPVSSLPVIDTPVAQAPGSDSSTDPGTAASTASTSTSSSTPGQKSAPNAAPSPAQMPAAVAPILPRAPVSRTQQADVVNLPDIPKLADIAAPTAAPIALSPVERLAMELQNPGASGALRTGALMTPTLRNSFSHTGSAPTALAANSSLWRDLDHMEEQMTTERKMHVVAGAASLVSVGMSVMYFMWAVRAGSVLSSLLSSMPAWKLVDPLPILDQMAGSRAGKRAREREEDDESLESMVQGEPGGG